MAFSDDNGGFAFACDDAKMSICVSTWNTRLSQIARVTGPIFVMTRLLPDANYISQIISKRPSDIFIIANSAAHASAQSIKRSFPNIRIVLHSRNNAKVVLVAPDTVWVSSSDFGKSEQIESAVGMHSEALYKRTLDTLFNKVWAGSQEIQ
ncbi:hypothetical protein [Xanthomonas arboricola]|uniref:hypothetical protein n=1 Tax=Xanthomonas arboricola TaxID=56448 RepID=UPI000CED872D|nr:hypothetical protein [Xanthomonas arboricola]PPU37312.1 hypothetical protein XaplCFBP3123_20600 [Xanthomonas arboricola pv. populi]